MKHVLLDNGVLGKISKEQFAGEYPVWQTSLVNPLAQMRATIAALGTVPVDSLSAHGQDVLLAAFRDRFSSS